MPCAGKVPRVNVLVEEPSHDASEGQITPMKSGYVRFDAVLRHWFYRPLA
jgi:hypothetical protein